MKVHPLLFLCVGISLSHSGCSTLFGSGTDDTEVDASTVDGNPSGGDGEAGEIDANPGGDGDASVVYPCDTGFVLTPDPVVAGALSEISYKNMEGWFGIELQITPQVQVNLTALMPIVDKALFNVWPYEITVDAPGVYVATFSGQFGSGPSPRSASCTFAVEDSSSQ